jgi:osmoprotectant transport system permease protein
MKRLYLFLAACLFGCSHQQHAEEIAPTVRIGSKVFTESVILGEILAELARNAGAHVEYTQTRALGSTRVVWEALRQGAVDIYPEYTGTISKEILAGKGIRGDAELRQELAKLGISMSRPLGFNNTYAIGMRKDVAGRLGITSLSDLANHPELKFGFSNEFLDRTDGWPSLRARYHLPQQDVRGLDHELAYRGLVDGKLDATDLYSTDAKIGRYKLEVLKDDLGHFPPYEAVLLYRSDFQEQHPDLLAALLRLEGTVTEAVMIDLNARVELDKEPESGVAAEFVTAHFGLASQAAVETPIGRLFQRTGEHLTLVVISLAAAIVIAMPLGIIAARWSAVGQIILGVSGLVQTIPSIALLVIMIPILGIGAKPAIAALFLYSLLPIVRNTYAGLHNVPLHIRESAEALGLPAVARLRLVELPMAARTILAGIKTAAVINVGTATLGGFIGAGGYGEIIFAGIRKGDNQEILLGAIPAALLALAVQGVFELAERFIVPKGLRLKAAE